MVSLLNRIIAILARVVRDVLEDASSGRTPKAGRPARPHAQASRPRADVTEYDVATHGLPAFSYSPDPDGDADPGEVVWTWVPYEEDATQGKDRPVLVLAREGSGSSARLIVAQLTSKDHDHDRAQQARHGRYWFDVGTGAWDPKGRPSEMRLDRLLLVDPSAVRREGATMSRAVFTSAVQELRKHWG
ncbi:MULTISPECIES: type II toxin-antitoxin system PemK/MazF family toxin [Actinomyces]|uniref:Type II toxin-antitoxin system PemK/MazF family toxin n=1 Tax=Actinomyces respiraculi TaxID=2744574 RepID=A0A7T0LIZ7_9ACTO|nr:MULTISPECIES: type II toxin-antitoxin system PemK/MazF family toxin [Actinomyces]QPL04624.1 type II toxin-antitoxin system PemK/MazF family toxin [Actinomyces respiraculi]